jgi:hypothetical protein
MELIPVTSQQGLQRRCNFVAIFIAQLRGAMQQHARKIVQARREVHAL